MSEGDLQDPHSAQFGQAMLGLKVFGRRDHVTTKLYGARVGPDGVNHKWMHVISTRE